MAGKFDYTIGRTEDYSIVLRFTLENGDTFVTSMPLRDAVEFTEKLIESVNETTQLAIAQRYLN